MKKLLHEIHRRSLWQVVGIYLAGSYGALEVVGLLTDNLGLPQWFPGLAFGFLILGLPVVLATAFIQKGIRDPDPPVDDPATPIDESKLPLPGARGFFTWRNALIGGAAAVLIWVGFAAGWVLFGRDESDVAAVQAVAEPAGPGRSIAVLPFVTRSESVEDRYFAEGMHDDLLTQLAKIDSLTVISRTSVMQFAETTKSIREIADELQVATVLEGGVQRAGDRVRINVQLIDAATDNHLWAETYDQAWTAENIFAIQTDLAHKIADALKARLTPETERRIVAHGTASDEALELYFRARYAQDTRGRFGQDVDEVIGLFRSAIESDSSYAPAWAGLAYAYLSAANWLQMPLDSAIGPASEAIDRAIALDPEAPEPWLARVSLLAQLRRFDEALAAAERAIALQPGSGMAYTSYASILESVGRREEALAASRRAVQLDPLSIAVRHQLSDRYYFAGDMAAAAAEARKVIQMNPDDWYGYYNLGWALAAGDTPAEAIEPFRTAVNSAGDNATVARLGLAYAFARTGQRDSALARITGIEPERGGYDLALVHFVLGDHDRAFDVLERNLRSEPTGYDRAILDPAARDMVAHPRFAQLIRRLGLD